MCADHRVGIERVALHDLLHALERPLHERIVDRLLNQGARRAGAHFALVQGEHGEALKRLVEEIVVLVHHVGEKDVGRLAAELERDRNDILGRVLQDEPAGGRLTGEGDLGNARAGSKGLACLDAEAIDHVENAGW